MSQLLFTFPLRGKRDLLRARQLTRQAADLLGFDTADQICLAAATFDLACQAHAPTGRATVSFEIADDCLQIACSPVFKKNRRFSGGEENPLRIVKQLSVPGTVSWDDVPWMLQQLVELAPLDVFEELRKINQEMLQTLLDQARRQEIAMSRSGPSAA